MKQHKVKVITGIILLMVIAFLATITAAEPYISQEGARFGMKPADIRKIEEKRNNPLKETYFSEDAYEMYFENDIRFYDLNCTRMEYDFALNDQNLFQIYYVSSNGELDYIHAKDLLIGLYGQPVTDPDDEGRYSCLYDRRGKGFDLVEAAHWVPENAEDPGVDLWYNDTGVVFIAFYDTANPASYGEYPENWSEWPVDELPDISE